MENNTFCVGVGVSGGIAAYKAIEVVRGLQKASCEVQVAMTRHAAEFIQPLTFRALTEKFVLIDDYAIENPDPIAHINFSQNIDLFAVVPATANIIAKFANGIADDFLTSTYLASHAPVLIAPAMNTTMWEHAATRRNVARLQADGVYFVEPISGELACKTVGAGKLADPQLIVERCLEILRGKRTHLPDWTGKTVLITAGGTREEIDPVRFISNHSSGKMGFAVAEKARQSGANVILIAGTTSVEPPCGVNLVRALSAKEMFEAVAKHIEKADIFIASAAVADYRPKHRAETKIKKKTDELTLELEKTQDILGEMSRRKRENQIFVGFAAETNDVETYAQEKMSRKNLDFIVANDVTQKGAGFNADTNIVTIYRRKGAPLVLPQMTKKEVAAELLKFIEAGSDSN